MGDKAMRVKVGGNEGEELRCQVCGYDAFEMRRAQLNTRGMTFLKLDWANRSATCYVCDRCGYIHWFLPRR